MGVELSYQAIPAESGFVELVTALAQRDLAEAQRAQFVPHWMRWGSNGKPPAPGREAYIGAPCAIWNWCCEAVGRYPGICGRNFFVGKGVGTWRFLFNATYRQQVRWPKPHPTDERAWNDPTTAFDTLIERAFLKAPEIAQNVVATQGFPIQYIDPAHATELGLCIAAMDASDVVPHLDELIATETLGAWDRDRFINDIANFQLFWRATAERGDGVLVVYD